MIRPPQEDPFFPNNWREQVREFLAPFQDEEVPSAYLISVVRERTEDPYTHLQATFRFDDIFLEGERVAGHSESFITIIYARKSESLSILRFWTYASLLLNAIGTYTKPSIYSWFDSGGEQSRLLSSAEFNAAIEQQCPIKDYLPGVLQEPMVQGWKYSPNWNKWFAVIETTDSYILWRWRTLS